MGVRTLTLKVWGFVCVSKTIGIYGVDSQKCLHKRPEEESTHWVLCALTSADPGVRVVHSPDTADRSPLAQN